MTTDTTDNTETVRQERIWQSADTTLVIAPLPVAEAAASLLTESERRQIASMACDKQRSEQTAWRSIVRRFAGDFPIAYTTAGAPYLQGGGPQIGVSHTATEAAVILSERRCAVDIERTDRDFRRIAARFVSPEEASMPCSDAALFLPILWCAKEALYKFSGRKGLGLTEDLRVLRAEPDAGTLTGAIRGTDGTWREYPMHAFMSGGTVCVWLTDGATAPSPFPK